jgi:hypothetical protein
VNPRPHRLEATLRGAVRALAVDGTPVDGLDELPAAPGLYTLSVRRPAALGELGLEDLQPDAPLTRRVLYLGKSESSLADRLSETHFATGESGRSTVRRTCGSLLGLCAISRPSGIVNPTRKQLMTVTANFAFEPTDDRRLTEWMLANLGIRVFPTRWSPLKTLERRVGSLLRPPLDQEKDPLWSPNPWRSSVAGARERNQTRLRAVLAPGAMRSAMESPVGCPPPGAGGDVA